MWKKQRQQHNHAQKCSFFGSDFTVNKARELNRKKFRTFASK